MLHLRLIVPPELCERVCALVEGHEAMTNLVVLDGAAREPRGDLVLVDVARESASGVIEELRSMGLEEHGSISVETPDLALSDGVKRAEEQAPGHGMDAVVWEEVEQLTNEESSLSATYLFFLAIAMMIAAVGVLLDQPILIVGSMVVGPEFGPLAGLCVGLVQRIPGLARRSALGLVVGFPVAALATVLFTWLMTGLGLLSSQMLRDDRPLTSFIWQPDALSWFVAFLAGVAGMLSLTAAKSGALVGVLISVTTVPAAANASVGVAYGDVDEASGSALQLAINLSAIVVAGVITLAVQKWIWSRPELQARSDSADAAPRPLPRS